MISKVYTVHKGVVVHVPVEKETSRLLYIKRSFFFGYSRILKKEDACLTEKEAVLKYLDECTRRCDLLLNKYNKERELLSEARDLAKKYGVYVEGTTLK